MSASPPDTGVQPALEALCRNSEAVFRTRTATVSRRETVAREWFQALRTQVSGASVLVRTTNQLEAAVAMLACDGAARRMVLCPPDFTDEHLPAVLDDAEIDLILESRGGPENLALRQAQGEVFYCGATDGADLQGGHQCSPHAEPVEARGRAKTGAAVPSHIPTEWVLFTSGTTGRPKLVVHTLEGLAGAIRPPEPGAPEAVWATFYDIRRYGGLQILLRALIGGADLVLSSPEEPVADFLARMGEAGATHVTGTPSHWRKALMSPAIKRIAPRYVRLSGEIADQAVLDGLRAAFPEAAIGHAYASTEAGVGFEVADGREGFPAAFAETREGPVQMRVVDGSLRLRSGRAASRYLGAGAAPLQDEDGFVDTGDMIERRGDRWVFAGRRGGIINVGGLKIHPEEVEAVINRHPSVSMSLVKGRRNPITGAIVTAEAVLAGAEPTRELTEEVLELCRAALPPHKVPASLKFVDSLAVTAGGKLERTIA
ncbi:MAG TPA: class I adenylate-forming enzyme family protein [Caulobacteraceae bacterium]|jgi:acyl-coenzyme A synthetase/AMP-(fatty) acid ligase